MELSVALEHHESVKTEQGGWTIFVMPGVVPCSLTVMITDKEPETHDLMTRLHFSRTLVDAQQHLQRHGLATDADWQNDRKPTTGGR